MGEVSYERDALLKVLIFNIAILGDSGAGKTRLTRHLLDEEYNAQTDLRTHVVSSRLVSYSIANPAWESKKATELGHSSVESTETQDF